MIRAAIPPLLVLAPFWLLPASLYVHLEMTAPIYIWAVLMSLALNKVWRRHRLAQHGLDPNLVDAIRRKKDAHIHEDYIRRYGQRPETASGSPKQPLLAPLIDTNPAGHWTTSSTSRPCRSMGSVQLRLINAPDHEAPIAVHGPQVSAVVARPRRGKPAAVRRARRPEGVPRRHLLRIARSVCAGTSGRSTCRGG